MTTYSHEEELFQKLQSYCAYRERCSFEVQQKLRRMGAGKAHMENIIKRLEKEGFLDDKRFTETYVKSKILNNNWGKTKVRYYLKHFKIPEKQIEEVFNLIDEEEYNKNLRNIIKKKYNEIRNDNSDVKKNKTANYCIQKGFETYLVWQLINETFCTAH